MPPEPPIREESRSSDELLGTFGNMPLASLREWLTVQLTHVESQMRKATSKPQDLTPELAAQARQLQSERKAMKDAYMKALNKLDHYARQD